ncbi:hypothetical protein CL616_04765 [archaeon]|nr:hypothetical protein [archaeon]
MRYLSSIVLGLGLLYSSGCADGGLDERWADIHSCDSELDGFFSAFKQYALEPNRDIIEGKFDEAMPVLPLDQPLHVSDAIDYTLASKEFCGSPNYNGKVVAGTFTPFEDLPGYLQKLTDGDDLVVINEDLARNDLEKFGYEDVSHVLDFYSSNDKGAFIDKQKLVIYFRQFENPREEMQFLWGDFLEFFMSHGAVGQNVVHEHGHEVAYHLGMFYEHLISHNVVQENQDITYSGDPVAQSGLSVLHGFAGEEVGKRIADILNKAVDQVESERSQGLEKIL